jgi:hypothetical protein
VAPRHRAAAYLDHRAHRALPGRARPLDRGAPRDRDDDHDHAHRKRAVNEGKPHVFHPDLDPDPDRHAGAVSFAVSVPQPDPRTQQHADGDAAGWITRPVTATSA